MARQLGGGDNIMGSKEAIVNVKFQDDLGNILENASKLKEVLDAVNSNFLAINSAVGITTNSMGRLSSQTQKLVATTQQLRNEYQIIADASQRIGISRPLSISGGAPFADTDIVRSALSGGGSSLGIPGLPSNENQALGRTAGLERLQTPELPRFGRRNFRNALESDYERKAQTEQYFMDDLKRGPVSSNYKTRKPEYAQVPARGGALLKNALEDFRAGGSVSSIALKAFKTMDLPLGTALETGFGYATAGIGAAAALYKAADYLVKGSTRYSGLTGGTGVYENTGAAAGSQSFVGLQAQAWREGLFNMAIGPGGYQAIQEGLLGAGYTARDNADYNRLGIRGMRYDSARTTLAGLYKRGLQNVDENLQLMQLTVERGNGSLSSLVGTIDNLREVALTTNSSLKVMMQTFTASMQGLIGGMNMAGNTAAFVAGNNAAAYSNATNTLLRGSGAPDYNNIVTQMMLTQTSAFQNAGINMQNLFYKMANPTTTSGGLGQVFGAATDQMVDTMVGGMFPGVRPGMTTQQAKDIIGQNSTAVMALMQSGFLKNLIKDPAIYGNVDATIEWLANNLTGNPQTDQAAVSRSQNLSHKLDLSGKEYQERVYIPQGMSGTGRYETRTLGRDQAINKYLADALREGNGDIFSDGLSSLERTKNPVRGTYYDYVKKTGQAVGWVESVLNTGGKAAGRTFVKLGNDGETMSMEKFIRLAQTDPAKQAMLRGEGSQRLLVGTREEGQKTSEITNWTDSAEMGGGGASRTMAEMTQEDLTKAIANGIRNFNHNSEGLRVREA